MFVPLPVAQKTDSSLLNVTRSNVPASYTAQVHHPGFPDDAITFRFDSSPLAADDVYIALIDSYYLAAQQLSEQSGNELQLVKDESFKTESDYYHFDIGSDLYAEPGTFTLWHLKTVLWSIATLQHRYNLRECDFIYRSASGPLLQGQLRNPAHAPPPREVVADPHTDVIFGGSVRYSHYGDVISFEAVAVAVLYIMLEVWARMTQGEKSASDLHVPNDLYAYRTQGLRFEVRAAAAYTFRLDHLLNAACAVARFGRDFGMRALLFVMVSEKEKSFYGHVEGGDDGFGGDLSATL